MAAIFQTTFFLMKMYKFWLRFHWSFVPKGPIDNIPALVQIIAWRWPGDKPLSEPMMVSLLTQICVNQPQWVKHPAQHYYNLEDEANNNKETHELQTSFGHNFSGLA